MGADYASPIGWAKAVPREFPVSRRQIPETFQRLKFSVSGLKQGQGLNLETWDS
jgi:hypothetical protein